ncbi:MAG: phosphatase PAP2 family protein [Bacillota bacterium]
MRKRGLHWRLSPREATTLAGLFLLVFMAVAGAVAAGFTAGPDQALTARLFALHGPGLTRVMRAVTNLGSAAVLVPLALVIATWVWGTPPRQGPVPHRAHARFGGLAILAALLGAWVLNSVLKFLFQRARPELFPLAPASGFSFPSGHAMVAVAFYSVAAYVASVLLATAGRRNPAPAVPPWHPHVLAGLALVVVVLVGMSRVYLGVHYPSDVIGGYLAGLSWALLCIAGFERLRHGQ